jgi:hypothetical protein
MEPYFNWVDSVDTHFHEKYLGRAFLWPEEFNRMTLWRDNQEKDKDDMKNHEG